MIVAYGSDLHFEFGGQGLESCLSSVDADVLVLAGDIAPSKYYKNGNEGLLSFLSKASSYFNHVVIVSGNHEYYGGSLCRTESYIRDFIKHYGNVHYLQNEGITLGNVNFYGATMWTPMAENSPLVRNKIHYGMNDFKQIRYGLKENYRRLIPFDLEIIHKESIDKYIKWSEDKENIVLVQHHAPSYESIPLLFKNSILNDAFYSKYQEDLITSNKFGKLPNTIIHGHVHDPCAYSLNGVEVLCNPRGYEGYEAVADTFKFEVFSI